MLPVQCSMLGQTVTQLMTGGCLMMLGTQVMFSVKEYMEHQTIQSIQTVDISQVELIPLYT